MRAVEEAFETLRSAGLGPDARLAFGAILDHVMNDFDSPQTRWAERAKYRFLIERLAGDEPLVPKPQPVNLTTADHAPRRPSRPVDHVLQRVETSEATGMSVRRTTIHHKEHAPTVDNVSAPAVPVSAADVASLIEKGVEAAVRRAIARPGSEDLLSSRVPAFLDKKREELGDNAKHLADYPGRIGVFLTIVGDKPIGSYSTDDMHRFRDIVDQIPVKAKQRFRTDDPFLQIQLNGELAIPVPKIDPVTVDAKYLSPIKTLFSHFCVGR